MRNQFLNGQSAYLGVIQPDSEKSIQVEPSLGYWTITVTYELLGNIPSVSVSSAVVGETSIVTTINKIISQSTTVLYYKIGETTLLQKDIGTSVTDTYIVPESAGGYFPAQKNATLTIQAETFVNDESYGVVSVTVN